MLFLKPPFHMIEGVAVFIDHANERQFYYLPAMPKLTTRHDPELGIDIPQIQLIQYRGNAGTGGFLTFEVNVGIEQERLDAIAMELKSLYRLREDPILAPVNLVDGTVRLMILGESSQDAPPDDQPPGGGRTDDDEEPRFVLKINPPYAAKPALYGDNQAIFSVELDQDGVQLVEASLLRGEMLPIGVVYSLDFLALRPAFTVKVTADWERVQNHFQESFGVNMPFLSLEIDKVVDELIEDQVIVIEVDSFLPEGEDAGSWVGRRDQALNDFKDMVLENFFEPSLEPISEQQDGWDKFIHTTERLAQLWASGAFHGFSRFTYTKRDITRIDKKSLNLTMNERVTVKRSIYPQANLKGLGQQLRDLIAQGQVDASRFILEVTLDDPWFRKREVTAHSIVNFDYDNVESINLTLMYDRQTQTLRLTDDGTTGSRAWNSVVIDNTMQREVEYQYRVNFKNVDTSERPGMLQSAPQTTIGDEFDVSPRSEGLYFIDEVKLGADQRFPWDRFPNISVEVSYRDEHHTIRLDETFLISQAQHEVTWKRFRMDPVLDDYQVRITYLASDHRDIANDWQTTNQERLIIRDPRPSTRTVQVIPAVAWGLVMMVFVELSYIDEANGVYEQRTLSFFNTDEDRMPKVFSVSLSDPEHRLIQYTARILLQDNRVITIPTSTTAGSVIFIRTDMMGHRIVQVQPASVDFSSLGIVHIEAHMAFNDANAGLSFADQFTFWTMDDVHYFEYDYADAEHNHYTCEVRMVFANGLTQQRDLGMLNGDKLVLPTA
jgi:hypothetical protein